MNDAMFTATLFSNDLLPGDLKNRLSVCSHKLTSVEKSTLFLDSVIEPSLISDGGRTFDKLVDVMEDYGYQHVRELAMKIRTDLLWSSLLTCY